MGDSLTDEKMLELKEAFEMFDRDKDGLINSKELGNILRSLGHDPSDIELNDMISDVDSDEDSKIDFNEFIQLAFSMCLIRIRFKKTK